MEEEDSFNLPAFNLLPTAVVQWGRGGPKDKQRVQSLEFADNPRRLFVGSTEGRVLISASSRFLRARFVRVN